MLSPAKRHFHRTLAAQAAAAAGVNVNAAPPMPTEGAGASEYGQLLVALGDDRRQLQGIQSIEKKIEAKRGMIARYRPWVEGALAAETGAQDEIVVRILTWAIDVADWPFALEIAAHVLRHHLAMPENFKRHPAVVIAEEVAEAGLKAEPGVDLATLQQVTALTSGEDMPDQVRAKLEKAIAIAFRAQADAFDPEAESAVAGGKPALLDAALTHFRRALALDAKCGVKKLIEALEREQKKLAPGAE